MKKWGLRILSAFLTFMVGSGVVNIMSFRPAPAAKVQNINTVANVQAALPPRQIVEDTQPTEETDEIMKPHQVSISPYEIKRLIDENKQAARHQQSELNFEPIWEQLNIKAAGKSSFTLDQCNGNCNADLFTLELDGKPGKETILGLAGTWEYRYLIFKQDNSQRGADSVWILMGYVDAFIRYSDPEHRVVVAGTQRWLAIGRVTGYGSGFGSGAEDWYEVGENGVAPVLSYQTGLFAATWGVEPGINRKTKVSKIDYQDGITVVSVQSSTSYDGYRELKHLSPQELNERLPLWVDKRRATFIKGPGMQKFVFDPLHSEMTEKELEPNYDYGESLTDEEFLKYNYRELLKIANERWTKKKEWLFDFLKSCGDSIEKQSLYETAVINDKCLY
ncbi:MAG: hypothetical protein H0U54_16545 [Acidobacteria bacterium]|nr:hypothetical protein [Acidobacteriota bacterium]